MEMKEILIQVLSKFDCREMLKKHNCEVCRYELNNKDTEYSLHYTIPKPTKADPYNYECRIIEFKYYPSLEKCGFTKGSRRGINNICYSTNDKETLTVLLTFQCIMDKIEEIRRDELLELL